MTSGLFLSESVDYKNFTIHVRTIFKSFGAGSRGSLEHRYSYMGTIEPAITASIVMPVHTFASPMTEDWATRQQALDRAIARAKRIIDGTVVE